MHGAAKRNERLEQQLEQVRKEASSKMEALQQRLDEVQQKCTTEAQRHIKHIAQRDGQLNTEHEKNRELMSKVDELTDKVQALSNKK